MNLSKFLTSLKTVWSNRKDIISGIWFSQVWLNFKVEREARRRMLICNNCPHIDKVGSSCFVQGSQPCCSQCGCSLEFKTHAPEAECPLNYWKNE